MANSKLPIEVKKNLWLRYCLLDRPQRNGLLHKPFTTAFAARARHPGESKPNSVGVQLS